MAPLCAGRDPELWATGEGGNRLALALCRLCVQRICLEVVVEPAGMIVGGVPYSDAGAQLPVCACGYPQANYNGGGPSACARCRVPDVPIPDPAVMRALRLQVLLRDDATDKQIAEELGISARSAKRARLNAGYRRRSRAEGPRGQVAACTTSTTAAGEGRTSERKAA